MRDLRGQFVHGEGRNETDNTFGNALGNRRQVRLGKIRQIGQAIEPPGELFKLAVVAECIECARMDTSG
jgi:hypothetical protein